jgi:4-aminobutyrate aminotransferase-like enzyme
VYFAQFGDNPVSATVGLAVLDVFERDNRMISSERSGQNMHKQIRRLDKEHYLIGDIRNSGLFAGVDRIPDGDTTAPGSEAARHVDQLPETLDKCLISDREQRAA